MIDADFKELARKTASDKDLRNKALNIAKNMMDIKEDLLLSFINFLMKKNLKTLKPCVNNKI